MTIAESEDQRLARNVNELLQELRVAQAGVQFLFGFLLAVTFTAQYEGDRRRHGGAVRHPLVRDAGVGPQ